MPKPGREYQHHLRDADELAVASSLAASAEAVVPTLHNILTEAGRSRVAITMRCRLQARLAANDVALNELAAAGGEGPSSGGNPQSAKTRSGPKPCARDGRRRGWHPRCDR